MDSAKTSEFGQYDQKEVIEGDQAEDEHGDSMAEEMHGKMIFQQGFSRSIPGILQQSTLEHMRRTMNCLSSDPRRKWFLKRW